MTIIATGDWHLADGTARDQSLACGMSCGVCMVLLSRIDRRRKP